MQTTVVNIRHEPCEVFIGRPSRWGNPWSIGKDGNRRQVIAKYREWIKTQPHLLTQVKNLKGRKLGCFCAPQMCHGDILRALADGDEV